MTDIQVRRAANYALTAPYSLSCWEVPRSKTTPPCRLTSPWYGHPIKYEFNQAKAMELLKEASVHAMQDHAGDLHLRLRADAAVANERVREMVKSQREAAGFQVDFKVVDWNSLIEIGRSGW